MLAILFRWHRRLALIVALPVVLWVISGLTHPLMDHLWRVELSADAPRLSALPDGDNLLAPVEELGSGRPNQSGGD